MSLDNSAVEFWTINTVFSFIKIVHAVKESNSSIRFIMKNSISPCSPKATTFL